MSLFVGKVFVICLRYCLEVRVVSGLEEELE